MHVVDGIHFPAFLAKLPEQIFGRGLTHQSLFHALHANRSNRDPAQSERSALDLSARIHFQKGCGGSNGEIAMPAGKFDKSITVAGRPARELDRGQQLVRFERGRHEGHREIGEGDIARSVRPG